MNKEIRYVGFYTQEDKKQIFGLQLAGASEDDIIFDQYWYEGDGLIELEIHDVPQG